MIMPTDGFAKDGRSQDTAALVAAGPGRYVITMPTERRPAASRLAARRPCIVYALGRISYDCSSIAAHPPPSPREAGVPAQPFDEDLSSAALVWMLEQGGVPVYALRPGAALAAHAYERLRTLRRACATGQLAWVSVPGVIVGRVTLSSGHLVSVLEPETFGLYGCSGPPTPRIDEARTGALTTGSLRREEPAHDAFDLFGRAYRLLRNPGASPRERAINYAATEAFQSGTVSAAVLHRGMHLDSIEALNSPAQRPGADCWDVKLTFASPRAFRGCARMVYRFLVDVSKVVPVTVDKARSYELP